jgi:predicted nucleic acid-binding protein
MPLTSSVPIVLDTSAALVLFATGHIREIAGALPMPVFAVQETISEARYLRVDDSSGRVSRNEEIDWSSVLADGTIHVLQRTDPQEFSDFVRFAMDVDDGEAAAAASALQRGYRLAIDDFKARRVFVTEIDLIWSLDLVHYWCALANHPADGIGVVLGRIRRKASYQPHRAHPLVHWWQAHYPNE